MEADRTCPQCGRLIPADGAECPHCRKRVSLGAESILLLSLLSLAALFVLTGFVASGYHATNAALGQEWYASGQTDLKAGRADAAIEEFRTALVYDRDNESDQLSLALALSAANRTEEARAYLSSLWERNPENAVVNLELGRLAARVGNTNDALRYYHDAMYADWGSQNPGDERRKARLELYNFLIQHGDLEQAQAELVAMAALLPPDPALYLKVGQLFMNVGDYGRAAYEFEGALKLDPNAGEATLAGAGEAEFRLGNYAGAQRYLERALREKPDDTRLRGMLEQANLVLGADPYEPSLSLAERNRRAIAAFQQAVHRLASCGVTLVPGPAPKATDESPESPASAGSGLGALADQARDLEPQVRTSTLRQDPDLVAEIMKLVFQIEQATTHQCGAPEPLDRALLVLASRHGSSEK